MLVVVIVIGWANLQMIIAGNDRTFDRSLTAAFELEHLLFRCELVDARAEHLVQEAVDTGLLASAIGAEEQQMREVVFGR